jgi:[protein-PII] uridylyltransferase
MPSALQRNDLLEDRGLRGRAFADAWTRRLESWLVDLWEESTAGEGGEDLALVAVGGQGRGELAPESDLDLLLLTGPNTAADGVAEKLWYPIWDAGLKLGHSVRSVRATLSLASEDLETATSLLSARHVAGDVQLSTELAERAAAAWRKRGRKWLEELARSVEDRHAAAGEVAFDLEPDLKEGRGGLRDVHALAWAVAAGAEPDAALMEGLQARHDALFEVRVELHRLSGKPGDRLLLQDQDVIATRLDLGDADELMARVSTAGRAIAHASDEVWHDIRSSLNGTFFSRLRRDRPVEGELAVVDARVVLADGDTPVTDPFEVLRVATLAARQGVRIGRGTIDALLAAPSPSPSTPWPEDARRQFCTLLLCGHAMVPVVEALDHAGLWQRLLPEWAANSSRPQRNAYHRWTVDRHLLEATAEAAVLAPTVPRPDLLAMGLLLHDIAKGFPERGDHSVVGAEMARDIAGRMGFDDADVDTIAALVRHHLLLPDVATRRDLDDRATLEFVAREVGTDERLVLLRAMAEADGIATGPAAWSPWKAQLVERLATRTLGLLGGAQVATVVPDGFPSEAQRRMLDGGGVTIESGGEVITIACPDRPGVFVRVAGALALHGLEVVEARIHSERGMALDEFRVRAGPSGSIPWERVERDVTRVLEGRLALHARIQERSRSHRRRRQVGLHQFAPTVRFDNGASAGRTVVEVLGPDSFGLLYRLARAFGEFDLDITSARIHTMGQDVVDTFDVAGIDGGRIEDPDLQAEIRRALLDAMDVAD